MADRNGVIERLRPKLGLMERCFVDAASLERLAEVFSQVADPRKPRGVRHPLRLLVSNQSQSTRCTRCVEGVFCRGIRLASPLPILLGRFRVLRGKLFRNGMIFRQKHRASHQIKGLLREFHPKFLRTKPSPCLPKSTLQFSCRGSHFC